MTTSVGFERPPLHFLKELFKIFHFLDFFYKCKIASSCESTLSPNGHGLLSLGIQAREYLVVAVYFEVSSTRHGRQTK